MRMIWAVAVAASLAGISSARADWRLVTSDLKETPKVTVNEFSLPDGLSVTQESGELKHASARDVVSLMSSADKKDATGGWVLTLRNGDILSGTPGDATENGVTFTVAELGDIEVPLKNVLTLGLAGKAGSGGGAKISATTRDVVRLANGDSIEGDFTSIKDGKVAVHTDAGDVAMELAKVERIAIAGVVPNRSVPPLSLRVTLASGSVLTTHALNWRVNDVTLKDPAGKERKTTPDAILGIEILGGRAVSLLELDPAKDEQVPYMGAKWATQINANVLGQPLKMGKQTYARGLGVHTKSTLMWELDGSFETLFVRAGVDDSSLPYGEANLSVVLDGKVLWEKKGVKAGDAAETLELPIANGRRLELRADRGARLDVQGRVDWANPVVTRK